MRVSYNEISFAPDYKREFHFVGTEGRASLVLGDVEMAITITKKGQKPENISVECSAGSHWGGDALLRDELVKGALAGARMRPDAYDGRMSTAIVFAANQSMESKIPVEIFPCLRSEAKLETVLS